MTVPTFTKTGNKASLAVKLDKNVFGVEVKNHDLLKNAYMSYQSNARVASPKTKTRTEVSGGGKKPWRQKGTGRARTGSIRNPIWRGGGIIFGPTGNENHKMHITTIAKRAALRQALSLGSQANKIKIIEDLNIKDGKVKEVTDLLFKIESTRSVLLVLAANDELKQRATRNIKNLKVVTAKYLTVYDTLNADSIVIEQAALNVISEWLGGKK